MSSPVTRKRARLDAADSSREDEVQQLAVVKPQPPDDNMVASTPTKDAEFWFEDGTVILVAQDVEFRVYSGILANHSPVFKEMLTQPELPMRSVPIHGTKDVSCPVLSLSDPPGDLRHILRLYMPQGKTTLYDAMEPDFEEASAFIRLGKKYQLTDLYDRTLQFLKDQYTDSFDDWTCTGLWTFEGWLDIRCIGVVNLARVIGEMSLLPTALLACISLSEGIVRGFTRDDGSQETLSSTDLELCFKAKTAICEARLGALLRTLAYSPTCKDAKSCRVAVRKAITDLHTQVHVVVAGDPFIPYTQIVKGKIGVCNACAVALDALDMTERHWLWKRLPELLGIEVPNWPAPVPVQEKAHP